MSASYGSRGGGGEQRPLVLVVDDFTDGRDLVCVALASAGFSTVEATNGQDALDRARELLPDLIVLDLALPIVDGWEVARRLKADPTTAYLPIVGFTAHAERAPLQRAWDAGCDLVLTKPCQPRALVDEVSRLIARARTAAEEIER